MLTSPPRLDPNETNWIVHVNENLKCMPADEQQCWKYPSIYKVPPFITDLNPKAYQPQVVSFGPYHYDDNHLRPMEEHKHRALLHFLRRSGKSLECVFKSLKEVAHELKDSYDKLDLKWKDGTGGEFLELMIMDGCFMLEIMRIATLSKEDAEKYGYAPNDPIFSLDGLECVVPYIRRDMLLLENQLPMLVLYQLDAIANDGKEYRQNSTDFTPTTQDVVNKLILKFHFPPEGKKSTGLHSCLHVLDVYRKGLLMEPKKVPHKGKNEETKPIIRSATELNEAGIKFDTSKTNSLNDISFDRGGVLKLPLFTVDDTTESMFLNVMTFERLYIRRFKSEDGKLERSEVTSYVSFMDKIINNEQDVALLHTQGIIQNNFGSDKAAANLFNSLCMDVTLPFNENINYVEQQISEHCEKPWNEWRANLNHTYFKNPWTIASLIAALFLFALTILQTVYTLLSYY